MLLGNRFNAMMLPVWDFYL